MAIARTESGLHDHRISRAGAMGLMQLMPDTASRLGVQDPFDTKENVDGAARYLRSLWRQYGGDKKRVVAAYNAGPGRVPKRGQLRGLPLETRHYVKRVLQRAQQKRKKLSRAL